MLESKEERGQRVRMEGGEREFQNDGRLLTGQSKGLSMRDRFSPREL